MNEEIHHYLEFLIYCLDENATHIPECVREINWHDLLLFADKQAIIGIYWQGIEKLFALDKANADVKGHSAEDVFYGNKPKHADLIEWIGFIREIASKNDVMDEQAAQISTKFEQAGFNTCILKGQGNALLYPKPELRMPGDIDIWLYQKGGKLDMDDNVRRVIAFCREYVPNAKACYHHIDFMDVENIPTEVHYRPSWLNCPWRNRQLQAYFELHAAEQFNNSTELPNGAGSINRPRAEFNVVFLLSHIYNHLLHDGIGLRQLIDYYYLLVRIYNNKVKNDDHKDWRALLSKLGLLTIGGTVSWILIEMLGMEPKYALVKPDERRGRFVMKEILAAGNFGRFDNRILSGNYSSPLLANLQRLLRDLRMIRYFPSECIWEPWFRIYHWWWRKRHS